MPARIIALDTNVPQVCDFCGLDIEDELIIYGVGGSQYLRVYHKACPQKVWDAIDELAKKRIAKNNDQKDKDPRAQS